MAGVKRRAGRVIAVTVADVLDPERLQRVEHTVPVRIVSRVGVSEMRYHARRVDQCLSRRGLFSEQCLRVQGVDWNRAERDARGQCYHRAKPECVVPAARVVALNVDLTLKTCGRLLFK